MTEPDNGKADRNFDELAADVMEKAAEDAARAPDRKRLTKNNKAWYVLVVLLTLLIGLTIWNIVRASSDVDLFSQAENLNGARLTVILTAQAVENYRDSTGTYPANLEMIGMDDDGLEYATDAGSYSLRLVLPTDTVTYRPGEDIAPFAAAVAPLFGEIER